MTWCLYYLTKHPEVEERVFAELDKVLGDEDIKPQVASELKWVHFTPSKFQSSVFCWWEFLVEVVWLSSQGTGFEIWRLLVQ